MIVAYEIVVLYHGNMVEFFAMIAFAFAAILRVLPMRTVERGDSNNRTFFCWPKI